MNVTGTFAQWVDFFRACEIPHEYSQSYASKFVEERVRPQRLSTYTKDYYDELGVKQGDRIAIEDYLQSPTVNGHPPQFAERKPAVRPPSASDDDIIVLPTSTVAEPSNRPARKPERSERRGLSATSTRRSSFCRPVTASPTFMTGTAKAPSTGGTDSDKTAASSMTLSPDHQLAGDARNADFQGKGSPGREALPCKQEDNGASELSTAMASSAPASGINRTSTERPLSIDETAPSPLAGNTDACTSTVTAPPNNNTADRRRVYVDLTEDQEKNYQQPESNGASSELKNSSHGKRSNHDRPTSAKNGKLRLSRPTAAACRSKAPPPLEMVHEDVFPPPELRNAHHQMSVDQLRRNRQLVEHQDEIGEVPVQRGWEEMEPTVIVAPTDEPMEAIPLNATLTSREVKRFAIAMQEPYRNSAEIPSVDLMVRLMPPSGNGRMNFDDDAEPAGRTPRECAVGVADDESPGRRRPGKRNPSRSVQDSGSRRSTRFACQEPNQDRSVKCDTCGKGFATQRGLAIHGRRCGAEKRHKCDECGANFGRSCNLTRHIRIHTGERPYECDECSQRYSRQDELGRHKLEHTGERPCVCDECGQSFLRNSNLTDHKRTHTGEMPYECETCHKRFKHRGNLSEHRRQHPGKKPHVWKVCGRDFTEPHQLVPHMRTHTGEKPFKCDECPQRFATSKTLNSHKRRQHDA